MQDTILNSLNMDTEKIKEINSADAFFYKLIFDEIEKKINLFDIVKNLSDKEILSIAKQMPHRNPSDDNAVAVTRQYIELMIKNIVK